jgi:hypothetical protein
VAFHVVAPDARDLPVKVPTESAESATHSVAYVCMCVCPRVCVMCLMCVRNIDGKVLRTLSNT